MRPDLYATLDTCSVPWKDIKQINYDELGSKGIVYVWVKDLYQPLTCSGFLALLLVWQVSPTALEGTVHGVWKRRHWAFHNLIGHPLMELLAMVGLTKAAVWVHDNTVPMPDKETWKRKYGRKI